MVPSMTQYTAIPKPETMFRDLGPWEWFALQEENEDERGWDDLRSGEWVFKRAAVLRLYSEGLTRSQIATRLGLSTRQVKDIIASAVRAEEERLTTLEEEKENDD